MQEATASLETAGCCSSGCFFQNWTTLSHLKKKIKVALKAFLCGKNMFSFSFS